MLFHPTLGYYSSGRVSFTQDYRTFPDALSPYFGQMIAQHIFDMWLGMRKAGTLAPGETFHSCRIRSGRRGVGRVHLDYVDRRASDESAVNRRHLGPVGAISPADGVCLLRPLFSLKRPAEAHAMPASADALKRAKATLPIPPPLLRPGA